MTILTILLFISCILFLIGYRKERSIRIALESEVRSFADRKAYELNQLLEDIQIKSKAMTAPIVKKPKPEIKAKPKTMKRKKK